MKKDEVISFKVDEDMQAQIEQIRERIEATAGVAVSRGAAIRYLIQRALNEGSEDAKGIPSKT